MLEYEPDVVAITETWLTPDVYDSEIAPPSYSVIRKDRLTRGGGVALLIKNRFSFHVLAHNLEAEAIFCKLTCDSGTVFIGCVYRSPSSGHESISAIQEFMHQNVRNSKVLLMGDFNLADIEWNTMHHSSAASEALLDIMLAFNLQQIVTEPTRTQGAVKNILDLILLSQHFPISAVKSSIIEGISDHDIPLCILPISNTQINRDEVSVIADFQRADDNSILTHLDYEFANFSQLASDASCDIDALWIKFKSIIFFCIDKYVPQKTRKQQRSNPWITREVIHSKRRVNRLRKTAKNNQSQSITLKLQNAKTDLRDKTKAAKDHYFNVTLPSFLANNPRRFWKHFSVKGAVTQLSAKEKQDKAESFNNFFQSVFTAENKNVPSISSRITTTIDDLIITDAGVMNLLLKIDPRKSSGPDNIPNEFLKRYAEWSSKYLGIIFRKSLQLAKLPSDWKLAKVIPIHKSGDKVLVSNYRPISLTSTSCKLLEHVIFKHITSFLEQIHFFSPNQHGFRNGLSTITQLTEVVHDLAHSLNRRSQTDMVLLDFSKAFDSVCHNKLIAKLEAILGNTSFASWIKDFLLNRKQFVFFEQATSKTVSVSSGVPQGSVLGPLLFLIYINDIATNIDSNIKLFADDCVIYQEINSHTDHLALSASLNTISEWCKQWQMSINVKKSAVITITKRKQPSIFNYAVDGTMLPKVNQHKYLGVTLTSDLNWTQHIDNVSAAALRKLFFLKRSLKLAPTPIKLLAYKTFIRPILEYANVVWFPHTKTNIRKLEAVQRKAIRFIHNRYRRTDSPTYLLNASNLKTLLERAKEARLKFLFQIIHNSFKINVSKYISFSETRPTRQQHPNILTEYSYSNETFKHSFFPLAIREWNQVHPSITNTKSFSEFVNKIEGTSN